MFLGCRTGFCVFVILVFFIIDLMFVKFFYLEDFLEMFVGLDMVFLEVNFFKCININNISFKIKRLD